MTPAGGMGGPIVVGVLSVGVGVAGIVATRAWIRRRVEAASENAYLFWSLGILAVLPAWLMAFAYLIPSSLEVRTHGSGTVVWVCSIALGLAGAIMSEARLRHLRDSAGGVSPVRAWSLGLYTMIPAWVAILLGLVVVLVVAP